MENARIAWVALGLASAWMAAIAWMCGMLHYPAFLKIAPSDWAEFHRAHTTGISVLVLPGMGLQALATLGVMFDDRAPVWVRWLAAGLTLFSFGWTFTVSGPYHVRLEAGYNADLIRQLIATNWPRSLTWTLSAILAGWQAWRT